MAEILGVVASGIAVGQLAVGVVEGIRNIRGVWSEFRDAPQDIENILEELEVLGQSLLFIQKDLENRLNNVNDSTAPIERVLEITLKAMTELNDIAKELSIGCELSKAQRKKKQWRALIRKDDINRIREKLHRAVTFLNLAVNGSIQSQQLNLMTTISAQLKHGDQHILNSQIVNEKRNELATWNSPTIISDKGADVVHDEWRFLPRAWTKMNGISIRRIQELGNWQYTFKTIRILESNSPIFKACAIGDIQQVHRLLSTRAATRYDVSNEGNSLLHISCLFNQSNMCKWLLQHGADVDLSNNRGLTPLHCSSLAHFNPEECHDTIRVLLENGLADTNRNMGVHPLSTPLHVFHGPPKAFHYLSTSMQKNYDELVDYAMSWQGGNCYGALPTRYVRAIFAKTPISPERAAQIDCETGSGRTLLHAAAANLVDSTSFPFNGSDVLHILHRVLAVKPDLHPRDAFGATPFDYLCYGTHSPRAINPPEKAFGPERAQNAVIIWLQVLNVSGVNIRIYLEKELRLHPCGALIHCRQKLVGIVRRFTCEFGELDNSFRITVKDERTPAAEKLPSGAWPLFDDNDDREIVDAKYVENLADWTIRFRPVVYEVVRDASEIQ
ncbi:ankyrin repeat-containing domain protein [Xylaria arbuscula]|nr:ankyrin repeat-containing domain protein [Xylaria arbuscula]